MKRCSFQIKREQLPSRCLAYLAHACGVGLLQSQPPGCERNRRAWQAHLDHRRDDVRHSPRFDVFGRLALLRSVSTAFGREKDPTMAIRLEYVLLLAIRIHPMTVHGRSTPANSHIIGWQRGTGSLGISAIRQLGLGRAPYGRDAHS